MKPAIILLTSCTACFGQYTVSSYVDFEGGTNGTDVNTSAMNSSLHGPAMNTWGLQNSTHNLQFTNYAQKDLRGNITVTGYGAFGPGGSMGIVSTLNDALDYLVPAPTAGGTPSMSIGIWFMTDIPTSQSANIDWFTVSGVSGGYVNAILFSPGDGSSLRISPEVSSGSISGVINLTKGTWYWVTIGYNVGGTNANMIQVYDSTAALLGSLSNNVALASVPNHAGVGCYNISGATPTGYHIWMDGFVVNTNGDFPLLPGNPVTTYSTNLLAGHWSSSGKWKLTTQ